MKIITLLKLFTTNLLYFEKIWFLNNSQNFTEKNNEEDPQC